MKVDCFLDTNVLIYAALGRKTEEFKRKRANELIGSRQFGISAQVLQEFYWVATTKAESPLTPSEALEWIEQLEEQPCASIDRSLVKIAIEISQRYRIAYWDGAVIAASEELGTEVLYTEDLNHGQMYGSVRVLNPFVESARSPGSR